MYDRRKHFRGKKHKNRTKDHSENVWERTRVHAIWPSDTEWKPCLTPYCSFLPVSVSVSVLKETQWDPACHFLRWANKIGGWNCLGGKNNYYAVLVGNFGSNKAEFRIRPCEILSICIRYGIHLLRRLAASFLQKKPYQISSIILVITI